MSSYCVPVYLGQTAQNRCGKVRVLTHSLGLAVESQDYFFFFKPKLVLGQCPLRISIMVKSLTRAAEMFRISKPVLA